LAAVAHPDLPREQAYVDRAYACLDRMRETLIRAHTAAATEEASEAIEKWADRRLVTFAEAERGLCFGRIDVESHAEPLYIGRRWVHDDDQRMLVVNWQAPAARPFYTASPVHTHGVTLRRRFRTRGRELLDISDEALHGSLEDAAATVDDFLLEELERSRDAHMRDIVATIQADQYRLIAREPAPPLVVQGGPGTGKTAVGLHRASFLLYTHRTELRRILVVGPNPTFMDYVSHVLPILGEENVEQRAVAELVEGVEATRVDQPEVEALKGDPRLAEVVQRAAETRLAARPAELEARLAGEYVRVYEEDVGRMLDEARTDLGIGAAARERFRMNVLRRFYERYGRKLGGNAMLTFEELERALRRQGRLTQWLDHVWPVVKPETLVGQLLGSRARLEEAADGILDPAEQRLLVRRTSGWSGADLPLIDEARALADAPPRPFGHVIVDEAQDLTPMQLRMIARRMAGAFTLLGDVAQATGAVPYGSWRELLVHLPDGAEAETEELEHAYRVPREIMDFALPLLAVIAPDVRPPRAYRTGGDPPRVVPAADALAAAFEEAALLAAEEGLLAVIAPASLREGDAAASVFDETRIPVLTPRESKGLEFDHVVVVEPARIVAEGVEVRQGLRELYVALTRPTKTLVVTHSLPLPKELGAPAGEPAPPRGASATSRT
jgi:DNA helicase IV